MFASNSEKWRESASRNGIVNQITNSIVQLQVYYEETMYASITEKQKVSEQTFIGLLGN
jgi:hypothetical protein